ncbi:MAG: hypothetical protein R2748_08040 [Bryobacterales bacterium]
MAGFVLGIMAAGLSSPFPNFLLGPWMIRLFSSGARHEPTGLRPGRSDEAAAACDRPGLGGRPVPIMIASQAVSPWRCCSWRSSDSDLAQDRKEHPPSALMHFGMGITLLFSLYMLYLPS